MKKYKINRKFTYEGKRYSIHANSEKEAAEKYLTKIQELESGRVIRGGETLLSDWANECVEVYKTNLAESTKKKYKNKVKAYVLKHIGHMRLKDVKPLHCQQVLNDKAGKSKACINDTYQILNFLFSQAVANDLIKTNPVTNTSRPAGTVGSRRAITEFEREHIWKVCTTKRKYYMYLLMLCCGCRPSEACEAMGKDIQTVDGQHLLHIRGTKSTNADRFVPIPNRLFNVIKNTPKTEYIASYQNGSKITEQNRGRVWQSCKRELNISMGCRTHRNELLPPYPLAPDLVPYCLRHAYCTDLARLGIDIRVAQKLMGHSDISLTANIYTNLDKNDVLAAGKTILNAEVFGQGESQGGTLEPQKTAKKRNFI